MNFNYSEELAGGQHSTGGLAGGLGVRRNIFGWLEEKGAHRAQQDWNRYISPVADFHGGMSSKYGLIQVAVPECLPERLEVIAYASEIGFLYDDCTELLNQEQLRQANDRMQLAFNEGARHGNISQRNGGLETIQAKLFREMMSIDEPRATTAMTVWAQFLQEAAGRQHDIIHESFEAYMQYRIQDVGEMFWFGLVTFGMALTVPETEIARIRDLTRPCWIVLALQNDICSYNKECKAAEQKDASHVVNALWFIMRDKRVDLDKARETCREHINTNVARYEEMVATHRNDESLSRDARVYLESLLYTISGDAAWSLICPRYNSDRAGEKNMAKESDLSPRQGYRIGSSL